MKLAKKLIPQLRFSSFQSEWKRTKTAKLGDFIGGGTPSTKIDKYWNGDILWISSSDISEGSIYDIEKNNYITQEAINKSATKLVPKNSVLMVSRVGIGKFAIADEDLCTSQDFTNLICQDDYSFRFIVYLFYRFSTVFIRLSQGTSIKGITTKDIKSSKFNIPSLPEQQKIADFLSQVDKKIDLLSQKLDHLEQYKKGAMQKLFSQEVRFKKDDGSDFPDWVEKRLSEISSLNKGKQLNRSELFDDGQYPSISGGIEPSGYTDKWNTEKNTIIISEGGNSCGYVNYIETKFWCGGHCYALKVKNENVEKTFLYQSLKFNQNQIMRLRVGSGLPNIQKKDLSKFKLKLPSKKEQTKIANYLSAIDQKISFIQQQLEQTQMFKKGLLQKMFV